MSSTDSKKDFGERAMAAQADALPWLDTFLKTLMDTEGDTDAAAAAVNVTTAELHRLKSTNQAFALAWGRAMKTIRSIRADRLETVAVHDAIFGLRKFRFTPTGESVKHPETGEAYYETERDHKLVLALLQSLDRETYGPRQIVTGADGGPVVHAHVVATMADIVRIAAMRDEGKIVDTEVVGEFPDSSVIDAVVVDEKV